MPEPLLTAFGVCLGYAAIYGYGRSSTAISAEAISTTAKVARLIESKENSQALFGKKSAAIFALREIASECSEDDWDGNGAAGVDPLAAWNTEEFIRTLPDDFPTPEPAAEPDGSISLDWIRSSNQIFSISVGTSNRLACAWLDGTERGHAVMNFDGVNLPHRFLSEIQPIVRYGKPSLRTP